MLHEIKKRLAYIINERCGFTEQENWFQADRMINRVIEGADSIDSIKSYISFEDYKYIESQIKVVKSPEDLLRKGILK